MTMASSSVITVKCSPNIDDNDCHECVSRRPWPATVTAVVAALTKHGVTWPRVVIMHGKDLSCAHAKSSSGIMDATLYVVAVDAHDAEAKHAKVFKRKDGHYVGVSSVINGSAF
jgi:hypothetical protein